MEDDKDFRKLGVYSVIKICFSVLDSSNFLWNWT